MIFWYFLIVIALIALIFATFSDLRTREVPNWLNYSFVATGIGVRTIYSFIKSDFSYFLYGIIGFTAFFAFANLMYYTKQWGGGDSKLLMGLGAMFGNYDSSSFLGFDYKLPFLLALLINIFLIGTIYGIIYSLFLGLKNRNKFVKEFKSRKFKEVKIATLFILALILFSYFFLDSMVSYVAIIFLIVAIFSIILLSLMKIVEIVSLYKLLEVNKLTEGDWLAKDVVAGKKIICAARNIGLTKEDIATLKKSRIKNVLIREGIPFVPGFLIGFLVTIIFGDFLFLFGF